MPAAASSSHGRVRSRAHADVRAPQTEGALGSAPYVRTFGDRKLYGALGSAPYVLDRYFKGMSPQMRDEHLALMREQCGL
jgi:hypothetical protein